MGEIPENPIPEPDIQSKLLDKRQELSSQTKKRVDIAASWSYGMAVVLLAAVIFSMPFPFVRRVWMKELWGYYGLMNALCFLMIANQMNHRSLSFALAGLGVLFHDQIRNWSGAIYYWTHHGTHYSLLVYLLLSLVLALAILFIFGRAALAIYRYQVFKRRDLQLYPTETIPYTTSRKWLGVLTPVLFYTCIYALVRKASQAGSEEAFGTLRMLGGGAFFFGFLAMGHTLDSFSKAAVSRRGTILKILIHLLCLGVIQAATMRQMHLESLLLK